MSLSPRTRDRCDRILEVMEADARAGGRRLDRAMFYLNRVLPPSLHAKRRAEIVVDAGRRTTRKIVPPEAKSTEVAWVPGSWWDAEDEITKPIPRATTRH